MSNDRSTSPISVPPPSSRQRRASLASGISFSDYLSRSGSQGAAGAPPSSMANTVAGSQPNHGRRLSITTLGLSGSPTQTSPFGPRHIRHGSISSSVGSNSANPEEAVVEDNENGPPNATPSSPFTRRLSFGAQALRDARGGSIGNGRYPSSASQAAGGRRNSSLASPPSAPNPTNSTVASTYKAFPQNDRSNPSWRQVGEGFNWSEALRTRAERAPSLGVVSPNSPQNQHAVNMGNQNHHQRAASIASMEQPAREMPKQPKQNKPDFFQEKILRGDFMD
ncbi:uncharacterized protein BO87DRAFT_181199 [Aspergillus neoniger CBS 115656]|uniref:Uncharacterized protein n=1 Tax=Aspergillus neoniger (strain CBS 115656) TaxID=1448310 RepID=A0A318YMD6_ASPNB|nr:hypothetical protein BO87DRAFT_181199 [Aspergillus neoniger CBS 115656]PYH29388.1 hypothetical protein BO87DRAFT_181199 [Aspergillus neoniger CBS 115656]